MHVVLAGSGQLYDTGAPRSVHAGDVLLVRGATCVRDAHPAGAETLVVRHGSDSSSAPSWVAALPPVVHLRLATYSKTVAALVALVQDEVARNHAASDPLLARLAEALLVAAARASLPPGFEFAHAAADPRIARTLGAIHERLAARWTIAEMAKIAGMSRAAFVRRFKEITGDPPGAYITRLRIEAAKRLLVETDEPAATIAIEVGYGSAYAFSRVFKRMAGQPPVVFRRVMRALPARVVCRAALALAA
jgi:AraC-like DNA-binding protein